MAYVIDEDRCINCSWCRRVCPTDTISYFETDVRKHRIDPEGCIDCDICAKVCPMSCISPQPEVHPTPDHLEAAAKDKARRWAGDRRRLIVGLRAYAESQVRRLA
ncbi:MAG TPA: 4Fe-4S binding protein [Dehalococcoidia bacterium]